MNHGAAAGFGLGVAGAKEFLAGLPLPQYRFFGIAADGSLVDGTEAVPTFGNIVAVPASKLDRIAGNVGAPLSEARPWALGESGDAVGVASGT